MCVCVCVCARARVYVCVSACVCVWVWDARRAWWCSAWVCPLFSGAPRGPYEACANACVRGCWTWIKMMPCNSSFPRNGAGHYFFTKLPQTQQRVWGCSGRQPVSITWQNYEVPVWVTQFLQSALMKERNGSRSLIETNVKFAEALNFFSSTPTESSMLDTPKRSLDDDDNDDRRVLAPFFRPQWCYLLSLLTQGWEWHSSMG